MLPRFLDRSRFFSSHGSEKGRVCSAHSVSGCPNIRESGVAGRWSGAVDPACAAIGRCALTLDVRTATAESIALLSWATHRPGSLTRPCANAASIPTTGSLSTQLLRSVQRGETCPCRNVHCHSLPVRCRVGVPRSGPIASNARDRGNHPSGGAASRRRTVAGHNSMRCGRAAETPRGFVRSTRML